MKNLSLPLVLFCFCFIHAFGQNPAAADSMVFVQVEQPADYPGGYGKMINFLKTELNYPKAARKAKVQGDVKVSFVIDKEGNIRDVKTIQSLSPECDAEAERIVKAMPKWIPGRHHGEPVFVRYVIPIRFRLR